MSKPLQIQDISEELQAKILKIGCDPDFVRFLMGWCGLRDTRMVSPYSFSEAEEKRLYRKARKDYEALTVKEIDWKSYWKERKEAAIDQFVRGRWKETLFMFTPEGDNPLGRPSKDDLWQCAIYLINYFKKITRRNRSGLIVEILFPDSDVEYDTVNTGISRYKKRRQLEGIIDIESLMRWYEKRKDKIRNALRNGIPLYDLKD